jgi:protein-disulfide isomerase
VLKEYPILGRDSEAVARIAQAAISQGKYFELYQRLFTEPGRATQEKALDVVVDQDAKELCRGDDLLGHLDIGARGRRVA